MVPPSSATQTLATQTAALVLTSALPIAATPNVAAVRIVVTPNVAIQNVVTPNEVRGVTRNEEGDRSVVADPNAVVDRPVLSPNVVPVVIPIWAAPLAATQHAARVLIVVTQHAAPVLSEATQRAARVLIVATQRAARVPIVVTRRAARALFGADLRVLAPIPFQIGLASR